MKFKRKLISCYIDPDNTNKRFYKLEEKIPSEYIKVNDAESLTEISEHWQTEDHWIADWNASTLSSNYKDGCIVEFEFTSTAYRLVMYHYGKDIGPVRNLNLKTVKILG